MIKLLILLIAIPMAAYSQDRMSSGKQTTGEKKEFRLTAAQLKKYEGVYLQNDSFTITVNVEESKLYGLARGDAEKMEFTPVSENKFLVKGPDVKIEFLLDKDQVTDMLVDMGGIQKFRKVK